MSLVVVPRERRWFISGCPRDREDRRIDRGAIDGDAMPSSPPPLSRDNRDAVVAFPFGKRILAVVDITSVMGLENEAEAQGARTAGLGRGGGSACLPFREASC